MYSRILVILCVIVFNLGIASSEFRLRRIFVTYRSFEHTACDFPGGPEIAKQNESGSRLTEQGKQHAYQFGVDLKTNYSGRLNIANITKDNFRSMATRSPRSQQSALIVEAGLLGNVTGRTLNWTKEEGNRTIFNKTDQYLAFFNQTQCPKFFEALSKEVRRVIPKIQNYSDLVEKFEDKYFLSIQDPTRIWLAYETLASMANESRPQEINDTVMSAFKNISEQFIFTIESNETIKKLSGGIMVDSLMNGIEYSKENRTVLEVAPKTEQKPQGTEPENGKDGEKVATTRKKREMSLLAVPQGVLAAMMGAFSPEGTNYGTKDTPFTAETFYPQDGSYMIAEYYANDNHTERKVRILYSPGSGHEALPLIYPNCENDGENENGNTEKVEKKDGDKTNNDKKSGMCTFEHLKEALKNVRLPVEEQERECKGIYKWMDLIHKIKDVVTGAFKLFLNSFGLERSSILPTAS